MSNKCCLQPSEPYAVTLLFCELYFTDPNARHFNVAFNQQLLLSNFSVVQAAGLPAGFSNLPSECSV